MNPVTYSNIRNDLKACVFSTEYNVPQTYTAIEGRFVMACVDIEHAIRNYSANKDCIEYLVFENVKDLAEILQKHGCKVEKDEAFTALESKFWAKICPLHA